MTVSIGTLAASFVDEIAPDFWRRGWPNPLGDVRRRFKTFLSTGAGRPKRNHAMREEYCALLLSALLFAGGASSLQAQTQTAAAAQPPDTVDLLNLSLEELLNVKVTSTTKSSLEIRQAPGVVRVFTRTDIVRLGFTTLRDVLRQIPGIQVIEYRTGHQTIWVRGVQSRYNNKVLLLIDGVPMHDSYYGHFDIDESLALDVARQTHAPVGRRPV